MAITTCCNFEKKRMKFIRKTKTNKNLNCLQLASFLALVRLPFYWKIDIHSIKVPWLNLLNKKYLYIHTNLLNMLTMFFMLGLPSLWVNCKIVVTKRIAQFPNQRNSYLISSFFFVECRFKSFVSFVKGVFFGEKFYLRLGSFRTDLN